MKHSYTYLFLIDDFEKTNSQMINLQKTAVEIMKTDEILKMLDKCIVSPKQELVDKIIKASI